MSEIIIAALGVYGVSIILAEYPGPFNILEKLRRYRVLCVICLSVWVAIPVAYLAGVDVLGYLAIIGILILIERIV